MKMQPCSTRDTSPFDLWQNGQKGIWKGVSLSTELAIVNAFTQNWVTVSDSFSVSTWQRLGTVADHSSGESDASGNALFTCGWSIRSLCAAGTNPSSMIAADGGVSSFPTDAWTDIPLMRAEGVSESTLTGMDAWLNTAYPNVGFAAH